LLKSIGEAIRQRVCPESAKAAKEYHQLINDAVFFVPDVCDRVEVLLSAHFNHQELAASAAYEIETGKIEFVGPPQTKTFNRALLYGELFPIQACMYLAHRARLYVLKAIVEFWLARERGEIKKIAIKLGNFLINLTSGRFTSAMASGLEELSKAKSFRMFPVFWQIFLWSWGGFILKDRLTEEYDSLSRESGVPVDEIPIALVAFDKLFPTPGGWFREPSGDSRKVLILMPPAMRGLGAFRRKVRKAAVHYKDLGYKDSTTDRMVWDNNALVRLLECADIQLMK